MNFEQKQLKKEGTPTGPLKKRGYNTFMIALFVISFTALLVIVVGFMIWQHDSDGHDNQGVQIPATEMNGPTTARERNEIPIAISSPTSNDVTPMGRQADPFQAFLQTKKNNSPVPHSVSVTAQEKPLIPQKDPFKDALEAKTLHEPTALHSPFRP